MNSDEDFGAVAVIAGVKNPITAAHTILLESQKSDAYGRIHPLLLAGRAESVSSTLIDPATMITPKALSDWKRWKALIESGQATQDAVDSPILQDTVGAVACAIDGDVSAGVSSGGILLKRSGRVGEAAIFGSGCWASGARDGLNAVACSISGAGEMIMRASLARQLAEAARRPDTDSHEEIERALIKFQETCARRKGEHANAGIILIVGERQEGGAIRPRLWCGFTTASFAVAYTTSIDSVPKASRMTPNTIPTNQWIHRRQYFVDPTKGATNLDFTSLPSL
ncbi:asparaginase [Ceratobasidium sp. AG-Ba]|nr:asparaginase [Ceratobasidium sp. AG-Ba]